MVLSLWILGSLIVSSSYSGNLKAHLTKPNMAEHLDTLESILESDFPVAIIEDGEEENIRMKSSQDPVIKGLWDNRVQYDFFWPLDVSFWNTVLF